MAADTKAAGLRAAARKARKAAASAFIESGWLLEAHAEWCEREARKLERAKEVKRGR